MSILGLIAELRISALRHLDGEYGFRARYRYYKRRLKHLGRGVLIDTGVFIYGPEYVSLGDGTHIDKNCMLVGSRPDLDLSNRALRRIDLHCDEIKAGEIRIGKNCHISQNCMIFGYGGVFIGDNCVMSAGAKVYSLTSMSTNPLDKSMVISIVPYEGISPTLVGKVALRDNVWIGIDTVVSPGVEIGKNSFIRSNSFVLKSFGENSHIAGDPAVYVRARFRAKETGDGRNTI